MAELHDAAGLEQVAFGDAKVAETEITECAENSVSVGCGRSDQEVDVAGEPRVTVERHRVPTDDDVVNVMRVQ